MKIFQVINVRWFNATAWYAITLSKLLADAGHDVTVLTQANTPSEKHAQALGLRTVSVDLNTVKPIRFIAATRHIIELIKTHQPDIVNCHRGEGFFLWGILKFAGFKFKLVRTRGDQRPPRGDIFNRWLHGNVADAVVVTNRRMANYFLDTMKTPGDDVWLIHGGVDTKKFAFDSQKRQKIRSEFGYSDSNIVVGLLGRFDRVKGHKETIEAIAELRQQGVSNIKLLLLGFDTAMTTTQIEGWIKASKIEDITQISGKRSDISACLSALDIGVVSSLWSEAIARSALEIMATEIPLVSTTVGVMPDLVSPAMLVEPGDAKALAHVIGMICHDEAMRKEVLLTQKRTMSQLTLEEFLKRSLNLYQSLLEDR